MRGGAHWAFEGPALADGEDSPCPTTFDKEMPSMDFLSGEPPDALAGLNRLLALRLSRG
jgi:hypothetical protein